MHVQPHYGFLYVVFTRLLTFQVKRNSLSSEYPPLSQIASCNYTTIVCMLRYIVLFLHFVVPIYAVAQHQWQLKKVQDGIRVYNRTSEGSKLKSIKVTCDLDASLSQLTALLLDAKAHEEWVYNTKHSYVVKQVSPTQQIYYSEISLPWPMANRDVVVLMTLSQDKKTRILQVNIDAIESDVLKKDGIVRVPQSSVVWKVTPAANGKLSVEYIAHADPGGNVPSWIVNSFSTKGPLETFKRLKKLISRHSYVNADYAFIVD
jgi:hypothetical protein